MPNNTTLPGSGTTVRDIDKGGAKTQVMLLDIGGIGAEVLASASNPIPVSFATVPTHGVTGTFWQATQPVSFTWSGLTDTQLRASSISINADTLPLPPGAATDAVVQSITDLTDTMVTLLSGISRKLSLPDRFDRVRVSIESGGNEVTGAYYPLNTGSVGESNTGRLLSRILEPQQFSDVAAARLYQQISVS